MKEQKKELLKEFYSKMVDEGKTKNQVHQKHSELKDKFEEKVINACIADGLIKRTTIDPDPHLQITDEGIDFLKG